MSEALNVDGAATAIRAILAQLSEDDRKMVLGSVLKNRCRKCFDYDPSGHFWCCYDSRGG